MPLSTEQLRELFERQETITRSLTRIDLEQQRLTSELGGVDHQRAQLEQSIADARWRVDRAHDILTEHNRLLQRHRWRFEIDSARRVIRDTPGAIEQMRNELNGLEDRRSLLQHEVAQVESAAHEGPALDQERQRIHQRLDADRKARATRVALDPPVYLETRLGRRPDHGPAAALWDETGARIDQHRTAFGITDTRNALGSEPNWLDFSAYANSHRAAAEACQRLDRALGRDAGIELSRRGLGISL